MVAEELLGLVSAVESAAGSSCFVPNERMQESHTNVVTGVGGHIVEEVEG